MKRLYVWSGDDVPGGIRSSLAESLEDAKDDITIEIVGSNKPCKTAEYDLTFLDAAPGIYAQAAAEMAA